MKRKKLKKHYGINSATISLNMEQVCNSDPLFPYKTDEWTVVVTNPRKGMKKGFPITE
jgi:hypothetical protein